MRTPSGFKSTNRSGITAITTDGADGIMTYYDLFSREYGKAPWILLLQDHGFGGNWDRFGHGGAMEKIALETGTMPEILLCADNTHPWRGYRLMNREVEASTGGMYGNHRYICRLITMTALPSRRQVWSG